MRTRRRRIHWRHVSYSLRCVRIVNGRHRVSASAGGGARSREGPACRRQNRHKSSRKMGRNAPVFKCNLEPGGRILLRPVQEWFIVGVLPQRPAREVGERILAWRRSNARGGLFETSNGPRAAHPRRMHRLVRPGDGKPEESGFFARTIVDRRPTRPICELV